jgi:hypothetical protein
MNDVLKKYKKNNENKNRVLLMKLHFLSKTYKKSIN